MCTQVSFVNSICTIKGGTHVNYIVDQITKCDAKEGRAEYGGKELASARMLAFLMSSA